MRKLKAYAKATPFYWIAKRINAKRKYFQAVNALGPKEIISEKTDIKPTVLIFSSMGIFGDQLVVDTLLGRELQRQGANVVVVLCDAQMKICHVSDRYAYAFTTGATGRARRQSRICSSCVQSTHDLVQDSGLTYAYFSDGLLHGSSTKQSYEQIDVTDEIKSGIIRFAASSHASVLKRLPSDVQSGYEKSAVIAYQAINGLFEKYQPNTVIAHHGIYLPQGIVQKIANQRGVHFYSWHFGYRKSTLIFSRGDTYHRELTLSQPTAFEHPLTNEEISTISDYLQSRTTGIQDWIHFNRKPTPFSTKGSKRCYFVCYTSVDWDAALHFPASVFSSQFQFLERLISIFSKVTDYDLLIRVHPAEITGSHPAALSVETYLNSLKLSNNIRVIGPGDPTSSYDLAKDCVAAIVYNTKLGIELPPAGIPVIVAGDCWIREKGFSYDVKTTTDLEKFILNAKELKVTPTQRSRALQFAHFFYFRRCIDTPELISIGPKFQVTASSSGIQHARVTNTGITYIAKCILHSQDVVISS